jgi:hypothetical protein
VAGRPAADADDALTAGFSMVLHSAIAWCQLGTEKQELQCWRSAEVHPVKCSCTVFTRPTTVLDNNNYGVSTSKARFQCYFCVLYKVRFCNQFKRNSIDMQLCNHGC